MQTGQAVACWKMDMGMDPAPAVYRVLYCIIIMVNNGQWPMALVQWSMICICH
jgi:hypothetical protein